MKIKKLLLAVLALGTLQIGTLFSATEDVITRYKQKTRKKVDAKTGKVKAATTKTETTKKAVAKPAVKKQAATKQTVRHHNAPDVKTSTEKKTIKHDLNPNKKATTHKPEHLRDPKTGRFESESQVHPHDAKTGRFTSKNAAASKKAAPYKAKSRAANKATATHDAKTGRITNTSATEGERVAPYAGAATAAALAGTSNKTKLTNKQKEARIGALAQDRQVARDNTDWKRSKNIKHYGRFDKLKHDTKEQRKQYGWRWLKAPWSTGTGDKGSYAFWNGQCGWMYYDLDKKEWWHPCTGRWAKEPAFETGSKSKK